MLDRICKKIQDGQILWWGFTPSLRQGDEIHRVPRRVNGVCCVCHGKGKSPVVQITDTEGTVWWKQTKFEDKSNTVVNGTHTTVPFQCEHCCIINLEGRLPVVGLELDDAYTMCLRQANLDTNTITISGRATVILKLCMQTRSSAKWDSQWDSVWYWTRLLLINRGNQCWWRIQSSMGMGFAVEMLHRSLVAKGWININDLSNLKPWWKC